MEWSNGRQARGQSGASRAPPSELKQVYVLLPLYWCTVVTYAVVTRFPRLVFLEMRDVTTAPTKEVEPVNVTYERLLTIRYERQSLVR